MANLYQGSSPFPTRYLKARLLNLRKFEGKSLGRREEIIQPNLPRLRMSIQTCIDSNDWAETIISQRVNVTFECSVKSDVFITHREAR